MAGRERIFGAGAGSFGEHQAACAARCSQDGVTRGAGNENVDEPGVPAGTVLGKDVRRWKQHAMVRPAVGIVEGAGIGNLESSVAVGPQALVTVPLQDLLQ